MTNATELHIKMTKMINLNVMYVLPPPPHTHTHTQLMAAQELTTYLAHVPHVHVTKTLLQI